jgi:glucokinase
MIALGIDIGGSHITAAMVDLESRSIIAGTTSRTAVNANLNAEDILNTWCEMIKAVYNQSAPAEAYIGIAMPGPFDYESGVSLIKDQPKFQNLYQVNIKNELAKRLNMEPEHIRFINDAASFLQGEVFGGAAKDKQKVIGLTLGTGLGASFCANGVAVDAALWDSAFKDGIAEDYLSTRWFISRYEALSGVTVSGVKELTEMHVEEGLRGQIFAEFGKNLGEFLIPIMEQEQPDAIVLGGNIANAHPLFMPALLEKLNAASKPAVIKIAELKEDASLIGAASCWAPLVQAG